MASEVATGKRPVDFGRDSGRTKTIQNKSCMTVLFSATRGVAWRRENKLTFFTPQKCGEWSVCSAPREKIFGDHAMRRRVVSGTIRIAENGLRCPTPLSRWR
eukprot:2661013-Prymnesium_polylepis.1